MKRGHDAGREAEKHGPCIRLRYTGTGTAILQPQEFVASLARTNLGHVVVFAEAAEVLVQLFHALLVCLYAFALQTLVELQRIRVS